MNASNPLELQQHIPLSTISLALFAPRIKAFSFISQHRSLERAYITTYHDTAKLGISNCLRSEPHDSLHALYSVPKLFGFHSARRQF